MLDLVDCDDMWLRITTLQSLLWTIEISEHLGIVTLRGLLYALSEHLPIVTLRVLRSLVDALDDSHCKLPVTRGGSRSCLSFRRHVSLLVANPNFLLAGT